MDLIGFILSLSPQQSTTPEPPDEDTQDLAWGSSVATITGSQSETDGVTGHFLWSPRALWHNGMTYITYPKTHSDEGLGQWYIFVYDENNGLKKPYRGGNTQSVDTVFGVADGHIVPVFMIDDAGVLYVLQERPHDTPIDIYIGNSFNNFGMLAEKINPGTGAFSESSYHNLIRLADGNFFSMCRQGGLYKATAGGNGASVSSSDGMEGWGSLVRSTTNPRPANDSTPSGNTDTRHYTVVPYYRAVVGDYIYSVLVQRVDNHATGLGLWHKFHAQRTPYGTGRGVLFENLLGTPYTHDVSGANYRTETVLDTNFLFYNSGSHTNNAFNPQVALSLYPKLYVVTGDANTGNLLLHIIDITARTLVTKPLNIDGYYWWDPGTYQLMAVKHMAYIEGGQYLEAGVEMDYGAGIIKSHLFRSYDDGDTWIDRGDVFPEIATSTKHISFPFNYLDIPPNRNFVITTLDNDPDSFGRKLTYFKRAAWGEVQAETPTVVVPATSLSDGNNFFYYVAEDGKISRSGNNVTGLTDQFGLRNATGVNNPQWNGSNMITLNGTNQNFNISSTGFSGLLQSTFFAVVRRTSATMPGILFVTNTAAANAYIGWFLNDGGAGNTPSFRRLASSTPLLIEHGDYVAGIDEDVLLTFMIDGRCRVDIYVNGLKQDIHSSGYSTLAQYALRGTMNYGTVNGVNIGKRDLTGTDLFFPFAFKALMMKNNTYNYDTLRAMEKKFRDLHAPGITLNYGYQ